MNPCSFSRLPLYISLTNHPTVELRPPHTKTKVYSLSQVARSIRKALERATANKSWLVKAEILSISEGIGKKTVYLDLVEEAEGRQNAKMRGIIWAGAGQNILAELGDEAAQILKPGSEVVFSARIQFHERYGLALHIDRIDLRFMLGELERRKQITTARLKDGRAGVEPKMAVPTLPQRIALVGSAGTSGFGTSAPGNGAPDPSACASKRTNQRAKVSAAEELAAGIRQVSPTRPHRARTRRRGKLDLDAYNDFELCLAIARSSVPVWTGIGHESDWWSRTSWPIPRGRPRPKSLGWSSGLKMLRSK